jgi:hypothetical protein
MHDFSGSEVPFSDNGTTAAEAAEGSVEDNACLLPLARSASSFVDSMTFTLLQRNCGCDECCRGGVSITEPLQVPETFRSALTEYKRRKLTEMPIRRSQLRTLIGRNCGNDGVAVWHWIIPPHAEPLVEFGNSLIHRLVWIQRLHRRSIVKHIGVGIFGSLAEEQGRKELDWVEDDVILIPSEGRKSTGYIVDDLDGHTSTRGDGDNEPDANEVVGPAGFYIAKVQLESVTDRFETHGRDEDTRRMNENGRDDIHGSSSSPFDTIRRICIRSLRASRNISGPSDERNSFKIDGADKELFRQVVLSLINKT